jgi:cysteine desulfurase
MPDEKRIYLDHHATTPVDPRVVDVMLPYFTELFGNPSSSTHSFGWDAERAVKAARARVASLVGARSPREIVFTSGATESNNLALRGAFEAADGQPFHLVTSTIEHPSILETCRHLESRGVELTVVGVDADGRVRPSDVARALRPHTRLVSVMQVNNEIGTIQPIHEIGEIVKRHGALFHCDAAQSAGRVPIDVDAMQVDLLSLSAHKLYGPKGIGALYARRRPAPVALRSQQWGGRQEGGLRSGTQNVPAIAGFGEAARLAEEDLAESTARLGRLRDDLLERLEGALGAIEVHGSRAARVAGNLNFTIPGVRGEEVLASIPDVAMSAGSACMSNKGGGSHVLSALGVPNTLARDAIRIGLGRFTTEEEVRVAAEKIVRVARRIRQIARPTNQGAVA